MCSCCLLSFLTHSFCLLLNEIYYQNVKWHIHNEPVLTLLCFLQYSIDVLLFCCQMQSTTERVKFVLLLNVFYDRKCKVILNHWFLQPQIKHHHSFLWVCPFPVPFEFTGGVSHHSHGSELPLAKPPWDLLAAHTLPDGDIHHDKDHTLADQKDDGCGTDDL